MKNLLTIATLGVVLLAACGNQENETLKKRIVELEQEVSALKQTPEQMALAVHQLKELDSMDLRNGVKAFQTGTTINIPSAWVFEETQLGQMLNHSIGDKHVVGIMAYPMNVGDTLKIALVPYYMDGTKKIHFDSRSTLKAYDFSDIVPSADGVDYSADNAYQVFGAQKELFKYKKETGE